MDGDWLCDYLVDVLARETQPSVRLLAEWSMIRLVLHLGSLQTAVLNILTQVQQATVLRTRVPVTRQAVFTCARKLT